MPTSQIKITPATKDTLLQIKELTQMQTFNDVVYYLSQRFLSEKGEINGGRF